jgi:HEAT repeat protein
MRDARTVDPLIAALKDEDALVREQAARALARLPRR